MANSLNEAAQNASATSAALSPNKCKFCGKEGLLILPLLYAAVPKAAGAPDVPGHLGQHVKDVLLSESAYTLRTTRSGCWYLLVNRLGYLSWQCYAGSAEGYLSQFAADTPPMAPPEFTCQPNTCGMNASMMAIERADQVETAYLLFAPDPLTTAKLGEIKSIAAAEGLCAKGQMVKLQPKAWQEGKRGQANCLDAAGTAASVAEFVLAKKSHSIFTNPLAKALANSSHPLMSDGGADKPLAVAALHLSRLDSLLRYMADHKAVAVAAYDAIGVTQALNDHRNDALNKVNDFLNTPDKEGLTNRWKFDTLHGIREVQAGFETGLANDALLGLRNSELNLYARYQHIFPDDPPEMRKRKLGFNNAYTDPDRKTWAQRYPHKHAALQADLAKLRQEEPVALARARAEAEQRWQEKYAPLIDEPARTSFDAAFEKATEAAMTLAKTRVDDHLAWVLHERLLGAFDLYDRKHLVSGRRFEGQSALCTLGMVGIEKCAAQVDAWLNAPIGERKNIYMRGLLLNQEDIEREAVTALANAADVAAAAPTVAAVSGDKMYKALKGLIEWFRKADSAWDEYVREGTRPGNARSAGLEKTREGAALFKTAELNRSVFRKGIGNLEKKAVGFFGGLVFARMGELAERLRFEELMYGIDPQNPHLDPKTRVQYTSGQEPSKSKPTGVDPALARDAGKDAADEAAAARQKMMTVAQYRDLQRKSGITFTAEEYLQRKSHMTSNYHQARIGALLAVMETIALGGKLHELFKQGRGTSIQYWEAVANLMSISSITCDIAYSLAKSARETATDTAVKGAGDIVRGGFKMWAGGFGAVAGAFGIVADFGKLEAEQTGQNRSAQRLIIKMRIGVGFFNTGAGALAAFSYSGPVFRRIAVNLALDAMTRRATTVLLAKGAEWLAARVLLLRAVAWGTGAGLLLAGGEIAYFVYLYYQPNALEVWLTRSAFRNRARGGNAFLTADNELEELAKARQLVGA